MADERQELRSVFDAPTSREKSERAHELVSQAFGAMRKTRHRQQLARDFLRGRISANLPKAIRDAAIRHGGASVPGQQDYLEYHAPQIPTRAMQMVAEFASKAPEPKRHPVARTRESGSVSNRIERAATGVMGQLYGYRQSCHPVLLDSEAATTVLPSTAHYARPIDQYDYCAPDEYAKLPEELKQLWEWRPNEADGDAAPGRYRRYSRKYRRDADGKPEWDDEYARADEKTGEKRPFKEDVKKSAEAVEEEVEERVRAKIPLQIDLLLPTQFAPINPRWEGDHLAIDGLARRETFGGTDLYRRGYRWAKDGAALIPSDAMTSIAPVTLDTLILQDGDGRPYLIYAIDGCRTWKQDGEQDFHECLDLHEAYGFDFLPVCYTLGTHVLSADPDDMVIPLLEPLIVPSLMRDRLVAMNDFHTAQTSCGGWFVKIDPNIQAVLPELARKPEFKVTQMAATPVPGDVVPAVHPGAGPGLAIQKEMLDLDLMQAQGPQTEDAGSGIHQALIDRDANRGMSMSWDGIDGLYAGTATNALRALACMARKRGKPITLNILTEMPSNDTVSATKSTVVVDADMFGGDYRVTAWRKDDWGSNPTRQAMLMDAQKNGQATWREMREAVGDADPEGSFAEILSDKMLMETDEGKQMILDEVAKINNDLKELERAKLRRDKLINEQNIPMDAAGGVIDPQAGGMPGVTLDVTAGAGTNPAASSLGASAGAPQAAMAQIAQQGGDVSNLDFGGAPGGV